MSQEEAVASRVSVEYHSVAEGCPGNTTVWVPYERNDKGDELDHAFLVVEEIDFRVSYLAGAENIHWPFVIGEETSSLEGSGDHRKVLLSTTSRKEWWMMCISHTSGIESTHTLVYTSSVSVSGSSHRVDIVGSEISTVWIWIGTWASFDPCPHSVAKVVWIADRDLNRKMASPDTYPKVIDGHIRTFIGTCAKSRWKHMFFKKEIRTWVGTCSSVLRRF
ncbi:hypothetical protein LIER_10777 [Lithospermum erythrorhizon]|uniref:Uncharacterized protein n=1 Tax=Lithospermum erythrorhizon TaxID=34254 RepID=A0AAV3PNE5_LITER